MADLLFPPSARISRMMWELITNTAVHRSIFTGAVRSLGRTGDRWRVSLSTENASDRETYSTRAALRALRTALRGQAGRIWIGDPAHALRGSFPAPELLTNATFENGTTGWFADSNGFVNSVRDRIYRATRDQTTVAVNLIRNASAVTGVQYAPYVQRVMILPGRNPTSSLRLAIGSTTGGSDYGITATGGTGYRTLAAVPSGTSMFVRVSEHDTSGPITGDYYEIPWISLSRCLLADVGANLLLRSDEFENASWTKTRTTVSANATGAPDNTSTADSIVEDSTASNTHTITQNVTVSSGAADYSFGVALKAGARTWAQVVVTETLGSTSIQAYINLSTGAVGVNGAGANWANFRPIVVSSLGNGWWYVAMIARKTNAATTLTWRVSLATGDNVNSYTGDGTSNIFAWRATLAASSTAAQLVQTTSAATSGSSPTGSTMAIKGGPASGSGLLLPGDMFEVITTKGSEIKLVTASLDTDAAGLGYLQFDPALRGQVLADAPIIVRNPMGRFVLTGPDGGWDMRAGGFSDFEFQFEEALDQ